MKDLCESVNPSFLPGKRFMTTFSTSITRPPFQYEGKLLFLGEGGAEKVVNFSNFAFQIAGRKMSIPLDCSYAGMSEHFWIEYRSAPPWTIKDAAVWRKSWNRKFSIQAFLKTVANKRFTGVRCLSVFIYGKTHWLFFSLLLRTNRS